VAVADFDRDGHLDVYVPALRNGASRLYRNKGDGTFEDVSEKAGVLVQGAARSCAWCDVDAALVGLALEVQHDPAGLPVAVRGPPALHAARVGLEVFGGRRGRRDEADGEKQHGQGSRHGRILGVRNRARR
jgi:hypothetical protein